jgi:hypothetical protein
MACLKTLWNIATFFTTTPKDFQGTLLNNTCHLKWIVGKFACELNLTIDILVSNTTMYIIYKYGNSFSLGKFDSQLTYPLWCIFVHGFVIKLRPCWRACDSFGIPHMIHFGFMGVYVNLKPKLGICNFLTFQLWSYLIVWVVMWIWNHV